MRKSNFDKAVKLFREFAQIFGFVIPRDIEVGKNSECETVSGPNKGLYRFNCDARSGFAIGSVINRNCSEKPVLWEITLRMERDL